MKDGFHPSWRAPKLNVEERAMAMDASQIEQLIKEAMPDATVEIRDLAGDGR